MIACEKIIHLTLPAIVFILHFSISGEFNGPDPVLDAQVKLSLTWNPKKLLFKRRVLPNPKVPDSDFPEVVTPIQNRFGQFSPKNV